MGRSELTDGSNEHLDPGTSARTVWDNEKVASAIADSIRAGIPLIQKKVEGDQVATRRAASGVLLLTGFVVVFIIATVAILSFNERISSDATAFLFGVTVGAMFAFLRDFFPKPR